MIVKPEEVPEVQNKSNDEKVSDDDEFHFIILAGNRDLQTKIVIMNSCTGNGTTFLPLGLDYITMGGLEVNNSIKYSFFVKDKFIRCNLLPNYIFETKPYIPYNFVKNGSFADGFNEWSNMSGITQEIVNDGLKYGKSCHLTSSSSQVKYKGIYQNIELLENTNTYLLNSATSPTCFSLSLYLKVIGSYPPSGFFF